MLTKISTGTSCQILSCVKQPESVTIRKEEIHWLFVIGFCRPNKMIFMSFQDEYLTLTCQVLMYLLLLRKYFVYQKQKHKLKDIYCTLFKFRINCLCFLYSPSAKRYGVGFSVCLMGRIVPHSLERNLQINFKSLA